VVGCGTENRSERLRRVVVAISMVVTVAVVVVDVTVRHGFLVERTCSTVTSAPEAHAHDATGWATSTASTRVHTAAAAHRRPPTDPPPAAPLKPTTVLRLAPR
jgi:hypothetical protein